MREEGIGLEHHIGRPEIGRDVGHVDAVDQDPPGGGGLEARQHAQQRGLAAARSAQEREELALIDVQGDIVDRREIAEFLGDVLDLDIGLGLGIPPGLPLLGLGLGIRHPSHPPFVRRQASPSSPAGCSDSVPLGCLACQSCCRAGRCGYRCRRHTLPAVMVGEGRPSTSFPAKGQIVVPLPIDHTPCDCKARRWVTEGAEGFRGHGGERRLTPILTSPCTSSSTPCPPCQNASAATTPLSSIRADQGQANSWMVGLRRP